MSTEYCTFSEEKRVFVIQVYGEYWEEKIEYVEKSDERDIQRDLRRLRRSKQPSPLNLN